MLNEEKKKAFEKIIKGSNYFITGSAGTGKSTLLNALIEYYEKQKIGVEKAAPTGIAAINIGGATLHSLFKLPLNVAVSKATKYPDFLDETDVLIIDEISMLRIDFLTE